MEEHEIEPTHERPPPFSEGDGHRLVATRAVRDKRPPVRTRPSFARRRSSLAPRERK